MDRYQTNGSYSRPYQTTCGMQCGYPVGPKSGRTDSNYEKEKQGHPFSPEKREILFSQLPLAMAYVPKQHFQKTHGLSYALKEGTIFPELCKPFCGKRGMKKC